MVRASQKAHETISEIAEKNGCSASEVVDVAMDSLVTLMEDGSTIQWPQLIQSMQQLSLDTQSLMGELQNLQEVSNTLAQVEAELSFDFDDLRNSVYLPQGGIADSNAPKHS